MSVRKQFTVGLENKPAQLMKLCSVLYRRKANIEALSVVDGADCSWVRFIASPTGATGAALRDGGFRFTTQQVLVKQIANWPGQLHLTAAVLASRGHNILYVYGSANKGTPSTLVIAVDDAKRAEKDVRGIKA